MRKPSLIIPAILILAGAAAAESRFLLSAGANLIRPADGSYRAIYGGQAIYPELAVAIRLTRRFCLTGSLGEFVKNGTTPDLGLETRAKQSYFSMGVGYIHRLSRLICLEAGAGLAGLKFREDALDAFVEGTKAGLMAEGGVLYMPEDGQVLLGLKIGFLSARVSDIASEVAGPQPVRLGGFKIAASFGIQLFPSR
jgi:hypothetical protein